MRVTENMNYDTVRSSTNRSRERMGGLQTQSATQRKINTPSDDPVGSAKVLEIRTEKVNTGQYQLNAKMVETTLNNTDHAVEELSEIILRAKEIAIGQSSDANTNDASRYGVSEEVNQLFLQSIAAANRRVGERYILGGYKTQHPPVLPDGKYRGDDGRMMIEVAKDVYTPMNVSGVEIFNTQPRASADADTILFFPEEEGFKKELAAADPSIPPESQRDNVNVFQEIQNLRIALLAGDTEGVRSTLERFDSIHTHLVSIRAKVGSRLQGVKSAMTGLERTSLTNAALGSTLEDADMAQVVSDLAKEETVFRSALQSSQKLVQPTLLDFLK